MGNPGDARTKLARQKAHAIFDLLWSKPDALMTRTEAYNWLASAAGREIHMGSSTVEDCELVISLVTEHYPWIVTRGAEDGKA